MSYLKNGEGRKCDLNFGLPAKFVLDEVQTKGSDGISAVAGSLTSHFKWSEKSGTTFVVHVFYIGALVGDSSAVNTWRTIYPPNDTDVHNDLAKVVEIMLDQLYQYTTGSKFSSR